MNTNERRDFEKLMLSEADARNYNKERLFEKHDDGRYKLEFLNSALFGWQVGRAALRAESEPVNLHRYINAANISASDAPHVVVEKLQKAINTAPQTEPKVTGSEI